MQYVLQLSKRTSFYLYYLYYDCCWWPDILSAPQNDCQYVGCGESFSDHSTQHAQVKPSRVSQQLLLKWWLSKLKVPPLESISPLMLACVFPRPRSTTWRWTWQHLGSGATCVSARCFWSTGPRWCPSLPLLTTVKSSSRYISSLRGRRLESARPAPWSHSYL